MKLLVATVALATALASPALAQPRRHVNGPAAQSYGQAWQNPAGSYLRQAPNGRAFGAYGWHRDTDPDPRIRDYLQYDPPGNYN